MAMHKFQIKYLVKGESLDEVQTTFVRFKDTQVGTAYAMATEYAVAISQRGWYEVTEIEDES